MTDLSLARGFPEVTEADWKKLVEEALKGVPFTSLQSATYDGIAIEPLYARAAGAAIVPGRTPGRAWTPMQRIDLPDPASANVQALDDLNNGAHGLVLVFQGSVADYGYALPALQNAIETALAGVLLDAGIDLELDFGPPSREAALLVSGLVKQQQIDPASISLRFGFDPLGALANGVQPKMPWSELAPVVVRLIGGLSEQGFKGPFFAADARPIHAAGGSEAQELGFALAAGITYIRALEAGGMALDDARLLLYFRLAADQEQLLTIAKFRALRKLWARIEEACGLAPEPVFISAETAWRMMTKRDPYGNIVRGTIAALAAAVGGANAIAVLPFTAALGVPDGWARRIARNTQTILIEESNLHRVADPAAGAGAIETLTDQLCRAAWSFFQDIERVGGPVQALETKLIQSAVAKTRAEREGAFGRRKEVLVGVNDFPDLAETLPEVSAPACETRRADVASAPVEPLPRIRLGQAFESFRDRSDGYLQEHGTRPRVFLATLGRPADFNARASFAKNLFEAGGIQTLTPLSSGERSTPQASGEEEQRSSESSAPSPGPVPSAPDRPLPMGEVEEKLAWLAKAFRDSGAALACICSSDKVYAAEAEGAAKALVGAGAKHVYLAGRPKDQMEALQAAGVGTFVYQGCDTLKILQDCYDAVA